MIGNEELKQELNQKSEPEKSSIDIFRRKLTYDEFKKSKEATIIGNQMPGAVIITLQNILEKDREYRNYLKSCDEWSCFGDDCGFTLELSSEADPWIIYYEQFDDLKRQVDLGNPNPVIDDFVVFQMDKSSWLPRDYFIHWDVEKRRFYHGTYAGDDIYIKDLKYHILTTSERLLKGSLEDTPNLTNGTKEACKKAYNRFRLLITTAKLSQYDE